MQKWEYLIVFIRDVDLPVDDKEADTYADADAFTQRLNTYGLAGWELVHMEPVAVGNDYDVMAHNAGGGGVRVWTNVYFCAFKRRLPG